MNLGFIGYGNMASAIISGVLKAGIQKPSDIWIVENLPSKNVEAQALGLNIAENIAILVNNVDVVFICVKPKDFTTLLSLIESTNYADKTFVSIAAGITIQTITDVLGANAPCIRAMPNTPLLLGAGTTALCCNAATSKDSYSLVHQVFNSAGTVYDIPESQFDTVINLNGSSPAYIYLFAKTITEFANREDAIPFSTCMAMFCDTLVGSAKMLMESGKTPDELIEMVSSPGGTTVAALNAFHTNNFVQTIEAGLDACVTRAKQLADS